MPARQEHRVSAYRQVVLAHCTHGGLELSAALLLFTMDFLDRDDGDLFQRLFLGWVLLLLVLLGRHFQNSIQ